MSTKATRSYITYLPTSPSPSRPPATVDLVTLDDLSAEAMLESSQRVEMLADTFRRRQEALSDPGPPLPLPPKVRKENLCLQLLGLWM